MNLNMQTTIRGVKEVVGSLRATELDMKRFKEEGPRPAVEYMRSAIRGNAPHASGKLKSSIRVLDEGVGRWRLSIGEGLYRPYHIYTELGIAPTTPVPLEWMHPPYGGIQGWAEMHMKGANEIPDKVSFVHPRPSAHAGYIERGYQQGLKDLDKAILNFVRRKR